VDRSDWHWGYEVPPVADIDLRDAVTMLPDHSNNQEFIPFAADKIRLIVQHAHDGRLIMWGVDRDRNTGLLARIPPSFWEQNQIELTSFFAPDTHTRTEPASSRFKSAGQYTNLALNRLQVTTCLPSTSGASTMGAKVPMKEAATRAYEQSRYADISPEESPRERLVLHAVAIFQDACDGLLTVYGKRPPSRLY
jgi:hypothetical protein